MSQLLKSFAPVALLLVWAMPLSDAFAQVNLPIYGTVNGAEIAPDSVPQYPGGEMALFKYIARNLRYPAEAIEEGIQGKVFLSFFIDEAGNLTNVQVQTGVHPALDREAARVVKLAQGWKPAYVNGQPVKYRQVVPVKFVLR